VQGSCEYGNESLGSIKCWEVAAQLAASQDGLSSVNKYIGGCRTHTRVVEKWVKIGPAEARTFPSPFIGSMEGKSGGSFRE
jgi:hypothetical protein